MAKSQIIKDLIGKKIELTQALERILIIAIEINDIDTIKWVKREKYGYDEDDIPDYRIVSLIPMGTFQLVSRSYIQTFSNRPLATIGIPKEMKDSFQKHPITQGISQLIDEYKRLSKNENSSYGIPIQPEFFHYFEKGTNLQITNAYLHYSQSQIEKIIDTVRTRAIELLVLLEKNFGVLDDLDIDLDDYKSNEIKRLQEACSVVIKGDNTGDTYIITNSKVKKSNIGKGNSSDKKSNVEISPQVNIEKETGKSIWKKILGFFGGKNNG